MDRRSEQTFFQGRYRDDQQVYEKVFKALILREMQIKITMRYHFTTVRMTIINKTRNRKCWWKSEDQRALLHFWWECKVVLPLQKTVQRPLKKLKIELPYDSVIPLPDICPKKTKSLSRRDTYTPIITIYCNIIYNSQDIETT